MKIPKIDGKRYAISFAICLAALIAALIACWGWVRSVAIGRAQRVAAQVAHDIEAKTSGIQGYADVPAAWLDVEGDQAKREIASSGDGTAYRAEFERIAQALYDPENMSSIRLAPDGVVRYVYPEDGNDSLLHEDLSESAGEELKKAADTREMTAIGPVFVDNVGLTLSFCVPVSYESGKLWGYTLVSMKLPEALESLVLDRLTDQGYNYELSCDAGGQTGKKERICGTARSMKNKTSLSFPVYEREWILDIRPVNGWISVPGVIWSLLLAFVCALLLAWILEIRRRFRTEAMNRLSSDAKHDKMTGLLNHTASTDAIDKALEDIEGGVLLLIDVDNFKTVNDTAGHLAGDEVLIEVANAMRTTFRRHDILGRYGGDEFIVYMIGDISIPDFSVKASQLQRKIRNIPIGQTGSYVTCSIGGARRCVETPSAEEMVKRADQALYTSKGSGKDRFTIYDDSGSTLVVAPKQDESVMKHDYAVSE